MLDVNTIYLLLARGTTTVPLEKYHPRLPRLRIFLSLKRILKFLNIVSLHYFYPLSSEYHRDISRGSSLYFE